MPRKIGLMQPVWKRRLVAAGGMVLFACAIIGRRNFECASFFIIGLLVLITGCLGATLFAMFPFERRLALKSRGLLTLEEIYEKHFGASGISLPVFQECWVSIARILKEDPRILLPTDRIAVELRSVDPFDHSTENAIEYVFDVLNEKGLGVGRGELNSLADLVAALATGVDGGKNHGKGGIR